MFAAAALLMTALAGPQSGGPALARMSVDEGTFGWHLSTILYFHEECGISTADMGNAAAYYDGWASTHAKYSTPQKLAWAKDNAALWALLGSEPGSAQKLCGKMRSDRAALIATVRRDVAELQKAHAAARTAGH
jgi:hypothetical protein